MAYPDPTTAIDTADKALQVAGSIVDSGPTFPETYRYLASSALAALLYGASPAATGAGISWVQQLLAMPGSETIPRVDALFSTAPNDRFTRYVHSGWTRAITINAPQAQAIRHIIVAAITPYFKATAS